MFQSGRARWGVQLAAFPNPRSAPRPFPCAAPGLIRQPETTFGSSSAEEALRPRGCRPSPPLVRCESPTRPQVSRGSEGVETSKDADVPRKPLTLVAQLPEFPQLDPAQGRPATEEKRHTLIAMTPRIAKLCVVEQ